VIVVAGEALIDVIISPDGTIRAVPGGGPYNAARTLGRLGADCTFLGVLADDRFGQLLRHELAAAGVELGCQRPTHAPSTLAVAQLSEGGTAEYRFYIEGTSLPMLSAREAWSGLPASFDALHVGTLGILVEPTASVLEALVDEYSNRTLIMLDPNCRPAVVTNYEPFRDRALRLIAKADLIKVSDDDVAFLFPEGGFEQVRDGVVARGGVILHSAGPGPIDVFTRDGNGQVTPPTGDIVDTVGAGDIFGATVLWSLMESGWRKGDQLGLDDVMPAVRVGAVAAHLACQRAGAEPPTRAELGESAAATPRAAAPTR